MFALLVAGAVNFGLLFNTQITLTHAAREGARVIAIVEGGDWEAVTRNALDLSVPEASVEPIGSCDLTQPSGGPVGVRVSATHELNFVVFQMAVPVTGRAVMRCGG